MAGPTAANRIDPTTTVAFRVVRNQQLPTTIPAVHRARTVHRIASRSSSPDRSNRHHACAITVKARTTTMDPPTEPWAEYAVPSAPAPMTRTRQQKSTA